MGITFRLGTRILRKLPCARESALCWFLILSTFVLIAAAYRVGIARGLNGYVAPQGQFLHVVYAVATKRLAGIVITSPLKKSETFGESVPEWPVPDLPPRSGIPRPGARESVLPIRIGFP
jgi:hypothetical protein